MYKHEIVRNILELSVNTNVLVRNMYSSSLRNYYITYEKTIH